MDELTTVEDYIRYSDYPDDLQKEKKQLKTKMPQDLQVRNRYALL